MKILEIKRKYWNTGQFQLSLSYTDQQRLGPSINLLLLLTYMYVGLPYFNFENIDRFTYPCDGRMS